MLATGVIRKKVKIDKVQKTGKISKKTKAKTLPKPESVQNKPVIKPIVENIGLPEPKTVQEIKKPKRNVMPSKYVTEKLVEMCLNAILKLSEQSKKSKKLFEDETAIFAQINCIKIQNAKGNISFVLPHSTVSSTGEVCLVTPDIKKGQKVDHEPTVEHWEDKLREAGVNNIKTVLPMRQLRVEYDQFELKRRLLTQHDFIMVDTRVLNHVSHLLGKMFFKKHNMLIPVRVKEKKLQQSVNIGLRTAMLRLSVGDCSTILVGHTGMTQQQLKDNVMALVQQLKDKFPGGEANIRSISLKLPLSMSVPLYLTLRSPNYISAPKLNKKRPKNFQVVEGELSTIPGSRVSVAPDGTVRVIKRSADSGSDVESDVEVSEDDGNDGNPSEEDKSS